MIHYRIGDAADPSEDRDNVRAIVHCCNDVGGWGAGFTRALSKRWAEPERDFRAVSPGRLGEVIWTMVHPMGQLWVASIIGQHGIIGPTNEHPVKYDALYAGLSEIADEVTRNDGAKSLHMPRMGAGLAGGSWKVIEAIVEETCAGLDVYVYDLPL